MRTVRPGVVEDDGVPIVTPRREPKQIHLRIDADLFDEVAQIAARNGRDMRDTIERLLKWAVARELMEIESVEPERPKKT